MVSGKHDERRDASRRPNPGRPVTPAAVSAKERPIIMADESVRATLENRKTVTRRVMKPQPEGWREGGIVVGTYHPTKVDRSGEEYPGDPVFGAYTEDGEEGWVCPYGQPGDRLWVRETWAHVPRTAYAQSTGVIQTLDPNDPDMAAVYRAGWERSAPGRWRPSIHMPRWASRTLLEVADVRVEQLQEITEEDARAEGAPYYVPGEGPVPDSAVYCDGGFHDAGSYRDGFEGLWNTLNAKRGYPWESNPWVFRVEYRRIEP